jgi:alanine-synthesizing transaminase
MATPLSTGEDELVEHDHYSGLGHRRRISLLRGASAIMVTMFSQRTDWKLAPNHFTRAVEEVRQSGRESLDLTVSNPTRVGIVYDGSAILDSLRNPKSLDYDPQAKGLLSAREAVAAYYTDRGEQIDPEQLVLTTSTSEGYSYIFRLLANPSDEVLVPKPSYPLFDFLAELQDVKLVGYPLFYDHGWQIEWPSLESAVTERTRAVVVVHPNNPTGSFVAAGERERLSELCHQRGLAMIVDEVFLDYAHNGSRRSSFVANDGALTFTLSGISKVSALPQMKLAWIAVSGPRPDVDMALQRLEVIGDTYLSLNAPVQMAADFLLGQRKKIQPQLMQRVRENLAELDHQMAGQKSSERLDIEGGWYAVVRVPVTQSDEELAIALLRNAGTVVHPGHFYDFPCDGYLVTSLITPENDFREGISRLLRFLGQ